MQIALLIDIDNARITLPVFSDILEQVQKLGKIAYCKIYGFNERKHMKFDELIEKYGMDSAPTMRYKKRAKSQLDTRIIIDAVNLCHTKRFIDSFCLITGDGDLVPLLAFLRACGKTLLTIDTDSKDGNDHMFDKKVALSVAYNKPVKLSKKELTLKLRAISEKTSRISDKFGTTEADEAREDLISEIETILAARDDDMDSEEQELYSSLEDLLTILK